ncbi:hypothetical protein BU23DRAFT_570067 [Bimuria novae-zelandiae CBS 107.79]|uniref:Uncharacterized protein n=1 Tax=Bimuria novae-zelandiae CBS 107.79 TaxID=1447943 RepID=A0A6A5V5I9_9PLEO|nr:hypothetical protein BU23DRAFT_570067 [Bimuria novae-zelandiae CBS 107.79]
MSTLAAPFQTDPEYYALNHLLANTNLTNPFLRRSDSYASTVPDGCNLAFTIASVLPKCAYKEEWEPKERFTDAYISTQVQVLDYLSKHAADELTVAQAYFFTENAGTKPYGPTAKQAVEICYFMRSFGFDVYLKMAPREKKIRLFLADRNALTREQDHLYWEQNLKTGKIASLTRVTQAARRSRSRSRLQSRARAGRRGAVADIWEHARAAEAHGA